MIIYTYFFFRKSWKNEKTITWQNLLKNWRYPLFTCQFLNFNHFYIYPWCNTSSISNSTCGALNNIFVTLKQTKLHVQMYNDSTCNSDFFKCLQKVNQAKWKTTLDAWVTIKIIHKYFVITLIFIFIHSLIHSLCLLFTGQGEKKSNCILHPRWPSGMKYKLKILVISKGLKKLKFDL